MVNKRELMLAIILGYNPIKRGRSSYSIKAAFIANNGDCVNLKLDGGKSHSKDAFKDFFKDILSLLPQNYKVAFLRIDKGYFGEDTFEYLEKRGDKIHSRCQKYSPFKKDSIFFTR